MRSTATVQFILSVRVRASLTFVREKSGANAGAGWRGGDPAVRPADNESLPCSGFFDIFHAVVFRAACPERVARPAVYARRHPVGSHREHLSHAGWCCASRSGWPSPWSRSVSSRRSACGTLPGARPGSARWRSGRPLQPADHRGWHLRGPAWMAWAALAPSRKSTTPCRRAGSRAFIAALTAQARSRSARSPRPRRLPAQCSGATAQARFPAVAGSWAPTNIGS